MMKMTTALLERMDVQLQSITGIAENDLPGITQAIQIVSQSLAELRSLVLSGNFSSPQEEIQFFKTIKPQFDGRIIFYLMLLRMQPLLPPLSLEDKKNYYLAELQKLEPFYSQHTSFWMYCRMDQTYLDQHYFLRQSPDIFLIDREEQLHYDHLFNSPMSHVAARFHGYELFQQHIMTSMALLEMGQQSSANAIIDEPFSLTWSAAKSALTELIYALEEYGAFNHSHVEMRKVANYFSLIFNIRLTNIYKTWEDIRLRKKNRTPFLDALKVAVEKRMDRDNDNAQ